ncbi:hypothetical protein Baya_2790 [Bagarius yarrelli]|uniref:Uncharacterized protein n=1 Tax=Bagarius yarrelli TaxID=175774 RepID=A0A556TQJ7_BAGYA|nr:hypothetical protein Baya_2790 [Bagarius yarrelli]
MYHGAVSLTISLKAGARRRTGGEEKREREGAFHNRKTAEVKQSSQRCCVCAGVFLPSPMASLKPLMSAKHNVCGWTCWRAAATRRAACQQQAADKERLCPVVLSHSRAASSSDADANRLPTAPDGPLMLSGSALPNSVRESVERKTSAR